MRGLVLERWSFSFPLDVFLQRIEKKYHMFIVDDVSAMGALWENLYVSGFFSWR